ncbi:hypothetical protein [Pseudomonas indica]|uniref:hypothetical protein n=1 Tax=Pseudomonas indica TaxID=137658 RepID=UPI00111458AC|nr:hypothetical protein [Pseudomonas indica]
MKDINLLKYSLLKLSEKNGLDLINGSADYNQDWGGELEARTEQMFGDLAHFIGALNKDDQVDQLAALLRLRARLLDLSNFFSDLYEDVNYLIECDSINWPEIPDSYSY